MIKVVLISLFLCPAAFAQAPTVVFGAAENAQGGQEGYLVVQPENAPNPLGNPIAPVSQLSDTQTSEMVPNAASQGSENLSDKEPLIPLDQASDDSLEKIRTPQNVVHENLNQDPAPFSETPQQEQNQIENTLYEGGDRIYDIQSYPLEDIKTVTEPNIDPEITDYPSY